MRSASVAPLRSEFENFLYAPIGQEDNGTTLSVLSALARQDVDPWEEAAKLARLPEKTAIMELMSLLDAVRHGPLACPDPENIAARLITLLPHRTDLGLSVFRSLPAVVSTKHPALVSSLVFIVIYMTLMLITHWFVADSRTQMQLDAVSTPTSSTVSPRSPPAN